MTTARSVVVERVIPFGNGEPPRPLTLPGQALETASLVWETAPDPEHGNRTFEGSARQTSVFLSDRITISSELHGDMGYARSFLSANFSLNEPSNLTFLNNLSGGGDHFAGISLYNQTAPAIPLIPPLSQSATLDLPPGKLFAGYGVLDGLLSGLRSATGSNDDGHCRA